MRSAMQKSRWLSFVRFSVALIVQLALWPALSQGGPRPSFPQNEYRFGDRVIRDADISAAYLTRFGGACYPRGLLVDLAGLEPARKAEITASFRAKQQAIMDFILHRLQRGVDESARIFQERMPTIAPDLARYQDANRELHELRKVPFSDRTEQQQRRAEQIFRERDLLGTKLFGSYRSVGGVVSAMDEAREIMGFDEVLFFPARDHLLASRDYSKPSQASDRSNDRLALYFRVQNAFLFGRLSESARPLMFDVMRDGRKSAFVVELEEFSARELGVEFGRAKVFGPKSFPNSDEACQRNWLMPFLDVPG